MPLIDRVRETIRRDRLATPHTRVVLAVSGGSDSVALAEIAREIEDAGAFRVAGIAHFNHQLRSTASRDEAACRVLAARLGWPFLADRADVAGRAALEHRSIEDAARAARYEFFARARTHFAADVVALGHTRDDQAETFLLRLLRGAGARGLASMHPRNGWVVRPLLDCRRTELREYLASRGVGFVEDETNADVSIPRNRIRAELLPLLESRFNPNVVDALAAAADLARDDWSWIRESAEALGVESATTDGIVLDVARLAAAPRALRRAAVWSAMTRAAAGRPVSHRHVDAALRLLDGDAGSFDAPGQHVHRNATCLVLTSRRGRRRKPENLFELPLSIPGEVSLPGIGWALSAEPVAPVDEPRAVVSTAAGHSVALVRGDLCRGPLAVRNRRPGDRFHPSRPNQRKKLQDFFVDRKVARQDRDAVPLVVDERGRIVWVAGYAVDAAFRVTDPAQGMLILRLRQLGGPV